MTEVAVRPAEASDASTIVKLLRDVYTPFRDRFAPTALREEETTIAAAADAWLLAETPAGLVGCVRHYPEAADYTFCFLAVHPRWRRQGVGTRLLESVLQHAAGAGSRRITIALRLSLRDNIRFFEKRGFRLLHPFETPEHALFVRELEE